MDEFERIYFNPSGAGFGLVPGPPSLQGVVASFEVHEIVEYPASDVAQTFSSLPNCRLANSGRVDKDGLSAFWSMRWRWESGEHSIDIDMTLLNEQPVPTWGGSGLTLNCTWGDLLELWLAVRKRFPVCYLHDEDSYMLTPAAFVEQVVYRDLDEARNEDDPAVRQRAALELQRFHARVAAL